MAWDDRLFATLDDLESQAEDAFAREREPELADRRRAEYASVTLTGRLMASVDRDVVLDVVGLGPVRGRLERVTASWCLLAGERTDWIVPLDAVAAVSGASERAVPEVAWPALSRLGLGSALRRLADAGERCVLHRTDGGRHDGVARRVGGDFVELITGEPARLVLVGFARLAAIQSFERD